MTVNSKIQQRPQDCTIARLHDKTKKNAKEPEHQPEGSTEIAIH
jgi:hypothetical protein